jgi:hypothetical protein
MSAGAGGAHSLITVNGLAFGTLKTEDGGE